MTLASHRRIMDDLFDEIPLTFARMTSRWLKDMDAWPLNSGLARVMHVRADVQTSPDSYVVHVDLPGMTKEDIQVDVDCTNRRLILFGERKLHNVSEVYRAERQYGSFEKIVDLPEDAVLVSSSPITAKMQDGVLEITIARTPTPLPNTRRISVQ